MTTSIVSRFLICCLVLLAPVDSSPATPAWSWPIAPPHVVTEPFVAPPDPYSAGHRGVDIAASLGQPVAAAAAGVVTFSGTVVDRPLVVIRHDDGHLSSIEPVVGSVDVGSRVTRGAPIGTVGVGGHCADHCVHFGVRRDGVYVNPMLLLGEVPPAVLLPMTATAGAQARGWALR
jgi:murein DD-endopeptidase MepM/ murein hydrolase activator NlpD